MSDKKKEKEYLYVEVNPVLKRKVVRLAKKADKSLRQYIDKVLKEIN